MGGKRFNFISIQSATKMKIHPSLEEHLGEQSVLQLHDPALLSVSSADCGQVLSWGLAVLAFFGYPLCIQRC